MIAIINIDEKPRTSGLHKYKVCINQKELFRFSHMREEPLSRLFKIAHEKALEYEARKYYELMKEGER